MNDFIPTNQWINLFLPIAFAFFFSIVWLFAFTKKLLFWLWLWQLKNYHWWRFLDHFRTHKGRRLIFNYLNLAKLSYLALSFVAFPVFSYVLLFILAGESFIGLRRAFKGKLIKPTTTKKTFLIIFLGILFQGGLLFGLRALFGYNQYFILSLALVDLLAPVILSLFILSFQPLVVFLRNRVLTKARNKRKKYPKLRTIGITGSYGKSSTKEFLAHLLSVQYQVLKTEKNINAEIGIARTILNKLERKHEFFVCEMGAYRKGGIKLLCNIAQPQIGILTGINQQHLATFGSQGNIIEAKFELIKCLPPGSIAIVNGDNRIIRRELEDRAVLVKKKNIKIIYCFQEELKGSGRSSKRNQSFYGHKNS
jgi:UDP-N-acetylmuramoyl-tripeptide--D-alanyl-D-alanine ligase